MPTQWKSGCRFLLSATLSGALVAWAAVAGGCKKNDSASLRFHPEYDEVAEALATAAPGGGTVFVNQAAADWFKSQEFGPWRMDVLVPDVRLRAGLDPAFWRSQDRAMRFDVVAILGEPGDARPLLRHLIESPDWQLAWVGASGCVLARHAERARPVLPAKGMPSARAVHWMLEAGLIEEARRALKSLQGSDDSRHLAFLKTWLAAESREWTAVLESTKDVDAWGPFAKAAAMLRARAFLERGEGKAAWRTTKPLAEHRDADAASLFLHARACRAAHAWEDEVITLKRIISLVEPTGAPTSVYQVYLGQALASAGKSAAALQAFQAACADPALPKAEREFAETAIRRLAPQ